MEPEDKNVNIQEETNDNVTEDNVSNEKSKKKDRKDKLNKKSKEERKVLPPHDLVLKMIKSDYEEASAYHAAYSSRIDDYRRFYADEVAFADYKRGATATSQYRSKVIKKAFQKIIPSITEPILSNQKIFRVGENGGESEQSCLLNFQWNRQVDKVNLVNDLVTRFVIDGTSVCKIDWEVKEEVVSVTENTPVMSKDQAQVEAYLQTLEDEAEVQRYIEQFKQTGEGPTGEIDSRTTFKKKITANKPLIYPVNPMSIYVSSTADSLSAPRFVIEEKEMTIIELLRSNTKYINLSKVIQEAIDSANSVIDAGIYSQVDTSIENRALFINQNPDNIGNKTLSIKEYWGKILLEDNKTVVPIVAAWYKDKLIRLEVNPYPHGEPPYAFASYTPVNNSFFGESEAGLLIEDQIGLNRVMRVMDNATSKYDKQQELIEDGLFTPIQLSEYRKGNTTTFARGRDPRQSIYKNELTGLPDNIDFLASTYRGAINDVTMIDPDMPSNVNGIDIEEPITDKEMSKLRNFLTMLARIGTLVSTMNRKFVVKGHEVEDDYGNMKPVDVYKLRAETNTIDAFVITKRRQNSEAAKLEALMNSKANQMEGRIAQLHYIELAKIQGRFKLAKEIEAEMNKPPEPDPFQELELEKLKLENAKIQLEMKRLDAEALMYSQRSEEHLSKAVKNYNEVEAGLYTSEADKNRATAQAKLGEAEKLAAQTQLFNQEFGYKDSGQDRKDKDLDMQYTHASNLEREKIRTERELKLNKEKARHAKEQKENDNNGKGNGMDDGSQKSPLLDYIKDGTLENDSYSSVDDVYRNIRDKNSTVIPTDEDLDYK